MFLFMILFYNALCAVFWSISLPAHSALWKIIINKILRNGNNTENMSFCVASLNAGKIITKKNLNPVFWTVIREITKTQPPVLNLSTILLNKPFNK